MNSVWTMIPFVDNLLNKSSTVLGSIGQQHSVCNLKRHWRGEIAMSLGQGISITALPWVAAKKRIENKEKGKVQELLLKQLAFDNASEDCQGITRPQRETRNAMNFLKLYKHRAKFAALETYAIQRQMLATCLNCCWPGHLKKQWL